MVKMLKERHNILVVEDDADINSLPAQSFQKKDMKRLLHFTDSIWQTRYGTEREAALDYLLSLL